MTIRLKLDKLMQAREISTRALSSKTGLAYNTILGLRRGSIEQIRFSTLDKLCEALGVEPEDIFEYEAPGVPPVGVVGRKKSK